MCSPGALSSSYCLQSRLSWCLRLVLLRNRCLGLVLRMCSAAAVWHGLACLSWCLRLVLLRSRCLGLVLRVCYAAAVWVGEDTAEDLPCKVGSGLREQGLP
uniref:Uncharacterized protein n=1 Tax=Dunaliella tertiolecta TaxID=3047 RepID=A0A7S3VSX6_DUNTE